MLGVLVFHHRVFFYEMQGVLYKCCMVWFRSGEAQRLVSVLKSIFCANDAYFFALITPQVDACRGEGGSGGLRAPFVSGLGGGLFSTPI